MRPLRKGDETIVELGSGSGTQVEVLKKLYPDLTVLCYDLPVQVFLCENYLSQVFGQSKVTRTVETLQWKDLSQLKKGGINCFGCWQIPLLKDLDFDVFWSAASFGEMEPEITENYLAYITGRVKWIYLLQARYGKETRGRTHVKKPLVFDDYKRILSSHILVDQRDAYQANKRLSQSGGYFEAVWKSFEMDESG